MKHLLKTETNGIANYKIVEQKSEKTIPYRPCIYKGVECAIIEKSINSVLILFEGKEIRVNYQGIEEV